MKWGIKSGLFMLFAMPSAMVWSVTSSLTTPPNGTVSIKLNVQTVASGLHHPWSVAFLPDQTFLVSERSGYLVHLAKEGSVISRTALALPELFSGTQGGLLEVALAPDFTQSARLFLTYACGQVSANSTCLAIAQWQNGEVRDIQRVFRASPDRRGAAHFGGRITFLPDATLLLTLGDGFDYREQAQNKANHLGKIVRLTTDGQAASDNPFIGEHGAAAEIFTLGHRNVQGIVYDEQTGVIYSHEHGPKGGDELNILQAGQNYGWPVATFGVDYTGAKVSPFTAFSGMQAPVHVWTPSIAPAGMTLYQGELFSAWQGNILVSALAGKALHRLVVQDQQVVAEEVLLTELDSRLRDVRSGPDGAIYLLTDSAEGRLLRLTPR